MYVKSLEFTNYRNLKNNCLQPHQGINVLCGNNAQGKTNLIECIWLCTGGRSFRGSKENEMIRFGENSANIRMTFFSEKREQKIELSIQNRKRKASLNGIPVPYMSHIIGHFCAVVFSPDHLTLVKSGPEERRSFIDSALCQVKPVYAAMLSNYKKLLNERNALLKDIVKHRELEDTLDIWDEQLAKAGGAAAEARIAYLKRLIPYAQSFYEGISEGKEQLTLHYSMNYSDSQQKNRKELAEDILLGLRKRRTDDIYCGYTTAGIHRDDLSVRINGKDARSFGSQGQQRSVVLALKLAEAAVLGDEKGETPVILLDDVLSELDRSRQDYLLKKLYNMQVFITCCENTFQGENVLEVLEGTVRGAEG